MDSYGLFTRRYPKLDNGSAAYPLRTFTEIAMANRQQRSNREKKKPKQPKKPVAPGAPGSSVPWKK